MYLCYIDESGIPAIPGNTSHFVLAGISIPIWKWKQCETDINKIKKLYQLSDAEIHTGWILREYHEQLIIPNFEEFDYSQRRYKVEKWRRDHLETIEKNVGSKSYHKAKKNYRQTKDYIHLTLDERKLFIEKIAKKISSWGFTRLFAECIDKDFFNPAIAQQTADEQAFEQLVSRFEQYLQITKPNSSSESTHYGLLIHDNNPTVEKKLTTLMKSFHRVGTLWTTINNIIETPLFVDSSLTSMIQIADLCAYSLRRYLEKDEDKLFDIIYKRADRRGDTVVGIRHYTDSSCICKICKKHSRK